MNDHELARLRAAADRLEIEDVLYRYCSTIDVKDIAGLRATLTDDFSATFGDNAPIEGADNVVQWIGEAIAPWAWQHHFLSLYHVDFAPDGDTARTLTYHTSHQAMPETPDAPKVIIARYHDTLRRTPAGWRITSKRMEILWRGQRSAADALPTFRMPTTD